MSNAGMNNTSSGPVPPSVPTSFVTDSGTVIPAANVVKINSDTTTANNVNGVQVIANPNGSNNEVVRLTNRAVVTATTSDGGGQTQTVTLFTPTNLTAFTYSVLISAYDPVLDNCAGGQLIGLARKSSGVVTVVGSNDTLDEADAALMAVDWNVISSGGNLAMQFVGIAGQTIDWIATFNYNQIS